MQKSLPYSRDFDPTRLLVDNYIPFHTLVIERELALSTKFDRELASFEDWDFLIRLSAKVPFHHVRQATCEYRHFVGSGHHALGALEDESSSFLEAKAKVLEKHQDRLSSELLSKAITGLRRESVELGQQNVDLRARWESDRLGRAHAAHSLAKLGSKAGELESKLNLAEDRYHREHGEVETLRGEEKRILRHNLELEHEIAALEHEIAALRGTVKSLREHEGQLLVVVEEHAEHLGRTYSEIERLMKIIEAMEQTRAWRAHNFFQRSKS